MSKSDLSTRERSVLDTLHACYRVGEVFFINDAFPARNQEGNHNRQAVSRLCRKGFLKPDPSLKAGQSGRYVVIDIRPTNPLAALDRP